VLWDPMRRLQAGLAPHLQVEHLARPRSSRIQVQDLLAFLQHPAYLKGSPQSKAIACNAMFA